jgi:type IV secretion system protein VirD4
MIDTPERERGSIISTLGAALALWGDEVVAGATSASDFSLRDLALREDPVTLYVTLPYSDLERLGPLVRMMLGVLTLRVTGAPPAGPAAGRRLLLLLDEFRALGRVLILEQMLAYLRGYGVRAVVVVQDLAQIRQVYSDRESITGNCQLQVFAATQNLTTRQHASRLAGEATVRYRRRSVAAPRAFGRHSTVSDADARRPLLTEGEIGMLPADHLLIFKAGLPPILAGKLPYYEHPELARRAALPTPPSGPAPAAERSRARPLATPPPPIPPPAEESTA